MKYDVTHFDRSNVYGCQGMQLSEPTSRCKLICQTFLYIFLIPLTLLFYPVYVMTEAFLNPFNMPRKYRCLCFCKHLSAIVDNCCFSVCLFSLFFPLILALGLLIGCFNLAINLVPAVLMKLYKIFLMTIYWRCYCCFNRHKE